MPGAPPAACQTGVSIRGDRDALGRTGAFSRGVVLEALVSELGEVAGDADGERSESDLRVTRAAAGTRRVRRTRTRGWSEDGPRDQVVKVRFSEEEKRVVEEFAERLGMRLSACVGELAVRYARGQLEPLPADDRDALAALERSEVAINRVGTLLNQIAYHANALNEFPEDTAKVLRWADDMLATRYRVEREVVDRMGRDR